MTVQWAKIFSAPLAFANSRLEYVLRLSPCIDRDSVCSLEGGSRVAVTLEGTVNDIGAGIDKVRHDGLILRAIPRDVARLSHAVSVASLMVLMEDRGLSGSPLAVSIGHRRVSRENTGDVPPEEVRVVEQSSHVELRVVRDERSLVSETAANAVGHEETHPAVGEDASGVEVLDGELTDDGETEQASQLGASSIVGPVEVRLLDGTNDELLGSTAVEPRGKHIKVLLCLISPGGGPLLDLVRRETEANKLAVLGVVSDLVVHHSPLSIIGSVLLILSLESLARVVRAELILERNE